ncbi:hypothetical protein Pmar_PMAR022519 [Perkinsus marinus ATCC 50983]|uniref:Uncharacterized protein n=1 Tax=Perkinsus marinus (strain ATCC 50983 / TXsc) TaxID=423536 RepID=C5KNH2_PERM5|nr:hypothetical protein Pmar_PMAR022519 [Perkinsus marinus ATCC 50983]EER13987.1 hypothetical protein Pmar_PMAR022519 [Perkinsus marinus ATCC 50983]|eukprot:XP_002782192.1 hypothetical protein Pmar_PMAR022519 [Perkinsus marinus ATCC 50983]
MFGFAILVSTVAAIMASGVPSEWCEEDHNVFVEEDCYDNLISCDFLPSGGIKTNFKVVIHELRVQPVREIGSLISIGMLK